MRKIVLFVFFICYAAFAQDSLIITPKKCMPRKGIHFKLKEIIEDSRCPQGVTCIWAGQVVVAVEVYKDKKLIEEQTLTFNIKERENNIKWFSKYFPDKKIKSIGVLPYPKEGVEIKPKKRYMKIIFQN